MVPDGAADQRRQLGAARPELPDRRVIGAEDSLFRLARREPFVRRDLEGGIEFAPEVAASEHPGRGGVRAGPERPPRRAAGPPRPPAAPRGLAPPPRRPAAPA